MEKLDRSRSKTYGPLVLWANDLAELLYELKDCKGLEFIADDIRFDSVDEFVEECGGRTPTKIRINASDPYLTIDLYPNWAQLYVSSSQLLASGLFLKVDSILTRCERKPRFLFSLFGTFSSVWIVLGVTNLPTLKSSLYPIIVVYALVLTWMFFAGYINLRKFSTVHPVRRESRPPFIKRNADGIVIAILAALLGAGAGAVLQR